MRKVWLAGGTTEGRELAAFLADQQIPAYVTVATDYGASLLPPSKYLTVLVKRLEEGEMEAFLREKGVDLVLDATHPYATLVSQNLQTACQHLHVTYERILRPSSSVEGCLSVSSLEEAVELLNETTGNIFLTTGSKNLDVFTNVISYRKRIYLRILPNLNSLKHSLDLDYTPKHIICMQGPFSRELNATMFKECQAKYIVTKDSGKIGGVEEKIAAAKQIGAQVIVIRRQHETGLSLESIKQKIIESISG